MHSILSSIDLVALMLYTISLGGIAGGVWWIWRGQGRRRVWGLILLVESLAAAVLLTLMSSKYWFGRGAGIIDISVKPIVLNTAGILIPIAIGLAVVIVAGVASAKLTQSRYQVMGLLLPCILIPGLFSISTVQLVSLTEKSQPVLPAPDKDIKVPPGFKITEYIKEPVTNPTAIVFGHDDNMYVANYNGDIWAISTRDKSSWLYATGLNVPVGLAWHEGMLYVASHGKVSILHDRNGDHVAEDIEDIVTDLPARIYPWHANNGIVFSSDGRLYFAVGSTTNNAPETYQYAASVLSVRPDGSDLRVFATGVRNPYRLAFNSEGDLFATDNGPDGLEITPGDELNHIVEGSSYGFPDDFALPPPGSTSMAPVVVFPPHASADGLLFYQGDQFPAEYFDDAFVTLWNLGEVHRIELFKDEKNAYVARDSTFVTGLSNPLDMAVGPNGSLYVSDYHTSVVYEISYAGND